MRTARQPEQQPEIPLRNLPKHEKYQSSYKPFDFFWGFGIEHETYIETSQKKTFTTFKDSMKPERYSVSYYKSYRLSDEELLKVLENQIKDISGNKLHIPILLNSHSFTHCDKFGTHKTTYEKVPKPNPLYRGETLFEWVYKQNNWFRDNYEKGFAWDGDTVEFMTQNFYKPTLASVFQELRTLHTSFNKCLQTLPKEGLLIAYGPLKLVEPTNYPFASYLTNPKNISMFNNGTVNINVTLPTRLGWKAEPLFWNRFLEEHRRLARLVQWVEPLWVAVYGSPDPLHPGIGAKGSQRVAVSRYIGLGTFDTNLMERGKILLKERARLGPLPWYDTVLQNTQYTRLEQIGMDINFNKHGAHGLELRFFDQMPLESLETVCKQLLLLCDQALRLPAVSNPRPYPLWQQAAAKGLLEGKSWKLTLPEMTEISRGLGVQGFCAKEEMLAGEFLESVFSFLLPGHFTARMSPSELIKKGCLPCLNM